MEGSALRPLNRKWDHKTATAECGLTEAGSFWVNCPLEHLAATSVPVSNDAAHVLLRPFRKIHERGPPIGSIHYGLIAAPRTGDFRVVYAVVVLDSPRAATSDAAIPGKLLLFPGWGGRGTWRSNCFGVEFGVEHLSVDVARGRVVQYVSDWRDDDGHKPKRLPRFALPVNERGALRLGSFYAIEPASLEEAGCARRNAGPGILCDPTGRMELCKRALSGPHVLHVPPEDPGWTSEHFVEVHFALADAPPSNEERPLFKMMRPPQLFETLPPDEVRMGWTGIPLRSKWLHVGLALVPGKWREGKAGWLL